MIQLDNCKATLDFTYSVRTKEVGMGTNFYFMSRNKELVQTNFASKTGNLILNEEYSVVDEPYLGYKIHLNKLSFGWRPLFQRHKEFKTFKELEKFYQTYEADLEIFDEYQKKYSWEEYCKRIHTHSLREKEPVKWVFEADQSMGDKILTLHTIRCHEEDAELFLPFDHVVYQATERHARRRFRVNQRYYSGQRYWNDPDYLYDWVEGEFS